MTTLTITNHKGGATKSTTAFNLSDAFARKKLRVLAIDLDPQYNLSMVLLKDKHPSEVKYTAAELLMEQCTLNDCIIKETTVPGVDLISGSLRLNKVEIKLHQDSYSPATRLADQLSHLENHYDIVVIDTPPSLGILTANAMVAATHFLVPLDAGSNFGREGTDDIQDMARRIRKLNPKLKLAGVLLTKYDGRKIVCTQIEQSIEQDFEKVIKTRISSATLFQKSEMARKTVLQIDRSSKVAKEYVAVADELIALFGLSSLAKKEKI
jgi:chromosome partitioning protein